MTMNLIRRTFAASLVLMLSLGAGAADGTRTERIQFAKGSSSATVQGRIKGDQTVDYLVGASNGQVANISLATRHGATHFNLPAPARLRSPIDDLIARIKAYHAGATHYTQAQLQQQYDLLLIVTACANGPPPASHDEIVRGELASIIAAKVVACGKVLDYALDDRLDCRVFCESGLVVRTQITAEGYVEATRHTGSLPPRP
jgi:hypothetical protein